MTENTVDTNHLELATELTIAWLSNPNTRASAEEVPSFLQTMHSAVTALGSSAATGGADDEAAQPEFTPAVTVRKSLSSKDHIISLIDGKPYKTLRRHLARHGLTPEQYRERYGLKSDYPMVAESYAEVRRNLAKKIGLGRKPRGAAASASAPQPAAKPAGDGAAATPGAAAKAAPAPRRKAREAAAPKAAGPKPAIAKSAPAKAAVAKKAAAPKAAAKQAAAKTKDAAGPEGGAKG